MKITVSQKQNKIITTLILMIPLSLIFVGVGYYTNSLVYFLPATLLMNSVFGIMLIFELGYIKWIVKSEHTSTTKERI